MKRRFPWFSLVGVAVILLPTVLLWNLDARFYYDWQNHEWFVGYCGEFFRQHHRMPQVFNAGAVVGLPQPIFYGWLFFPALGAVSALTGAALALRIGVVATFALQFAAVNAAATACGLSRGRATVLGAIVTWAIYPLTNLYNRAALTEFFAVAFLTSAAALAVAALRSQGLRTRWLTWCATGCALMAIGTHPPTAMVGGGFLALLAMAGVGVWLLQREWRPDVVLPALCAAVLGAIMLAPWVYANVRLHDHLYILVKLRRFAFFPERTDSFIGRFMPFPYDALAVKTHGQVSTPFAEAQIAMSLVLVLLWQGVASCYAPRARRPARTLFLALIGGWALLTLSLSLSPTLTAHVGWLAPYVQFPSRFVSQVNLALLLLVLLTVPVVAEARSRRVRIGSLVVYGAAAAIAFTGVVMKLPHAAFVREMVAEPRYAWNGDRSGLVTAGRMDAATDYAAVATLPQLAPAIAARALPVALPVGAEGDGFGRVGEVEFDLDRAGWIVTNTVVFPWAHVLIDDQFVAPADRAAVEHRAAFRLAAGHHRLRWLWQPDPVWLHLRVAAAIVVVLYIAGLLLLAIAAIRDSAVVAPADVKSTGVTASEL